MESPCGSIQEQATSTDQVKEPRLRDNCWSNDTKAPCFVGGGVTDAARHASA